MSKKVLVALGGNAILKHKEEGTAEEQFENVRKTCEHLVWLIEDGYKIAITHGNGPQVGDILLKNEHSKDLLPPMPLDICGAQSQGMIGYMLQQSMRNEMNKAGINIPVVSLTTQAIVDKNDIAFKNPTKPIGPFYNSSEAEKLRREKEWVMVEDSGRGYRRVVPSPQPKEIVEKDVIRTLFESGAVVIAVGGGGVPVIVKNDGSLEGVVAVIDKDLGAQIFASDIGAEILLMLTDVEKVSINYGKSNQVDLDEITIVEAKRYLQEGHFALGSMAPKVEAAIKFLEARGEKAVISSLEMGRKALEGKAGTTIHS
ncbi:MAG: carbamate kinase [Candidatus Bathyarchaeota archaeon]|nr:carbamate kinase [Candidatus Bathyarchaeota archaeon]MDH5494097.1 carbamate kinase [Candidatus Bathyarchaeota archaeon]